MCDLSHEDVNLQSQARLPLPLQEGFTLGTHSAASSSSGHDSEHSHSVSFKLPFGTRSLDVAPAASTATTACSTPETRLTLKLDPSASSSNCSNSHREANSNCNNSTSISHDHEESSSSQEEHSSRSASSSWLRGLGLWSPQHWCCLPKESGSHDANQLTTSLFQDHKMHPSIRVFEPEVEDQVWDTLPAWQQMSPADWTPRCSATGVALADGRILLMGGTDGQTRFREVWRSTSFGGWQILPTPPWAGRMDATAVALPSGEVLLLGGEVSDHNAVREVWSTKDAGMSWQAYPEPAWHGRARCAATVLPGGQILVMGGVGMRGSLLRDVWLSEDGGKRWIQLPEPPWTSREAATAVTFTNKGREGIVRLIGGFDRRGKALAEVWRSDHMGLSWEKESDTPSDWQGRGFALAVPIAGNIIMTLGGVGDDREILNDAWGIHPERGGAMEKLDAAPFTPRGSATVVSSSGKIVVLGGLSKDNVFLNDVWYIDVDRPCLSLAKSTSV